LHDVVDWRPENSRAAIEAAIEHGFGIEIDVQLSADGQAMVFHDYGLERLTFADGPLRQRNADDLAQVELIGNNEGIPNLAEVLGLVAGRIPVLIEIKDQDGAMGPDVGPLERAVASLVSGYSGDVAVMSFNPNSVAEFVTLLPDVPRGLVTSAYNPADWPLPKAVCTALRDIPDYDRVGASFISHEAKDLDRARVTELKARGADILCWTVRSAEEETQARRIAQNVTFEGYLPT
jgi:glycerophosphoryl diester phosphodiesterase